MKKFVLIITILSLFFCFINTFAYAKENYVKKDISVVADDGFSLKATLTYPKDKTKKDFYTVVLLHSLGTSSQWWSDLPELLLSKGYAVLAIDLRGHGASIYNKSLKKVSWTGLTNTGYSKMPSDVMTIINDVKEENLQKTFFNKWAIVGSDLGGIVGVIAADKLNYKPETIVLLSPVVSVKGLYVPVKIAQLDRTDFLTISSVADNKAIESANYLKKFAQCGFTTYITQTNSTGMVLLKNDPELTKFISAWIEQYLK
ncbi:MAG: alpha/beta fold hydrolase [bacterium]|nr:alpha/beta fold hydrolase [bacterium]